MDARDRGRFVWHELNTTDPSAAERFYRGITGWGMLPFEQVPTYRMWTADGVPQGGLMRLPEQAKQMGAPPHWLSYVGVPDVDAGVRQATSLGARTFVPAQDIPGGGRFAVLADPQGAVFAVHSSPQLGAPEAAPKVGEFSWHELATTDPGAAWRFYEALFGWKKMDAMQTPMGLYQMFGRGTFTYGGMYTKPKDMPAPPNWLAYICIPSVEAASPKVTAQGGKILAGPMDVPGGDRIVMCMDPQGAAFALHSKAAVAAAARKANPASKPAAKRKGKAAAKPKRKVKASAKRKASSAKKKGSSKKKATRKGAARTAAKARGVKKSKPKPKASGRGKARRGAKRKRSSR